MAALYDGEVAVREDFRSAAVGPSRINAMESQDHDPRTGLLLQAQSLHRESMKKLADLMAQSETRIYAICMKRLKDPHDAEEATNDTLLELFKSFLNFDPTRYGTDQADRWIFGIANHVVSRKRQAKPRLRFVPLLQSGVAGIAQTPASDGQFNREAVLRSIGEALGSLAERERVVVVSHFYGKMKFKEIASVLGITEGNARQINRSALVKLRGHLPTI